MQAEASLDELGQSLSAWQARGVHTAAGGQRLEQGAVLALVHCFEKREGDHFCVVFFDFSVDECVCVRLQLLEQFLFN